MNNTIFVEHYYIMYTINSSCNTSTVAGQKNVSGTEKKSLNLSEILNGSDIQPKYVNISIFGANALGNGSTTVNVVPISKTA